MLREQGRNPQVAASLRQKHCGTENGTPKVCCPTPSGGLSPVIDQGNRNPTQSQSGDFSECGRSEKKDTRIVGGKNATLGTSINHQNIINFFKDGFAYFKTIISQIFQI